MNRVLFFILALMVPINLALSLMAPLWANYVSTIGGDVRDASNVFGISTWVGAFFLIVIPKVKRWLNIPDVPLLLLSYLFPIGLGIWYFYITQVYEFYILQALLAVGGALSTPIMFAWYQNFLRENFAQQGWGLNVAVPAAAAGVGGLVSGHIVYHHGYADVFKLYVGMSVLSYIVLLVTIYVYKKDLPNMEKIKSEVKIANA